MYVTSYISQVKDQPDAVSQKGTTRRTPLHRTEPTYLACLVSIRICSKHLLMPEGNKMNFVDAVSSSSAGATGLRRTWPPTQ